MTVSPRVFPLALVFLALCASCNKPSGRQGAGGVPSQPEQSGFTGSSQCKTCHEAFYRKWSTSHHGLAMQPFTDGFAKAHLTPQREPIGIGRNQYRVKFEGGQAWMEERGPKDTRKLSMLHVIGGKNVYYFLTPLEGGRLQVMPLAYDVQRKVWYDTAASGVRMHNDGSDAPLEWTDPAYTFNTSCYGCHVSQLQTNYDPVTNTYNTVWAEPGINCEVCHGPGQAHIDLFRQNLKKRPDDLRILRIAAFTHQQKNETCAPCHAKMSPISTSYQPAQRFFDHYDLVGLEDADFYPDGRDVGENYTYTGWLMSPCLKSGVFDCLHCHTSSGRYRFAVENPNGTCLPCHQDRVDNLKAHSHHLVSGEANRCIACHMPKTRFAGMNRSDHSMLPPAPAATLRYRSPNACNLCHTDRDAPWADGWVRRWSRRDYQKPVLERAGLIDAARKRDWTKLPAILAYLKRSDRDVVFTASLVRLLIPCNDERKWPALVEALKDPSPLVRAAAAAGLQGRLTPAVIEALVHASGDEYRLVRVRAASALAHLPAGVLDEASQAAVNKATDELLSALRARSDDFAAHTNLGNHFLDRGETAQAIASYETALRLRPDSVGTLVNASIAYSRASRTADAERVLREALALAPDNMPASLNLGLLLAEQSRRAEAEAALRTAVKGDPTSGTAAYNLCVLLATDRPLEALGFCRQAVRAEPANPKYLFTLAYYQNRQGDRASASRTLEQVIRDSPTYSDAYFLLAEIYSASGQKERAARLLERARSVAAAGQPAAAQNRQTARRD